MFRDNVHAARGSLQIIAVALAPVVLLLPFAGKPAHIDDPVYIWVAQRILESPLDFYGGVINWYGAPMRVSEFNQNPPGVSFYLAIAGGVAGWNEIALHLWMLLPAAAVSAGVYVLAKRMNADGVMAALLAVTAPGFVVSASTLMADVLMLALYTWCVLLWIQGLDMRSRTMLGASAACGAAAILTKYFAVSLVPLLLVYTIARERRPASHWWWLAVPVLVLGAYQWHTARLYGHSLFSSAAAYAAGNSEGGVTSLGVTLAGLCFAGGCFAGIGFAAPIVWRRRALAGWMLVAALSIAAVGLVPGFVAAPDVTKLSAASYVLAGAFIAGGIHVFAVAGLVLRRERSAETLLLLLWLGGTFVFSVFVNWTVNARSLLPMIVPASIFLAKALPSGPAVNHGQWGRWMPVAVAAVLSMAVSYGDYQLAGASRDAAAQLGEKYRGDAEHTWFEGHWGFQYYLEREGFRALDYTRLDRLAAGDRVIIPSHNTNVRYFDPALAREIERIEVPMKFPVSTLNIDIGAGSYAGSYGPLPFVFGNAPSQTFTVFEISEGQ